MVQIVNIQSKPHYFLSMDGRGLLFTKSELKKAAKRFLEEKQKRISRQGEIS